MKTACLEWVASGTCVRGSDSPQTWTNEVPRRPIEGARA